MNDERAAVGAVALPPNDFPLLAAPDTVARTLRRIEENLGLARMPNPQLDVYKLQKIQNPIAGDTAFKVEGAGGVERESTITGIIVSFRPARVYYKRPYGAGQSKQPPDCSSKDGFWGEGDPGGDCTKCPFAVFGTARQGTGQACSEKRELLVVLPGQLLPHLMSVTPTSLTAFTKYSLSLASAGANYWEVISRMQLEPSTTASGMPIARIRFTLYKRLPAAQAALLTPYHESMTQWLRPMEVDTTPFEVIEPPGQAPEKTGGDAQRAQAEPPLRDDDVPF